MNGHRSNIKTNRKDRSPYVVPHFRTPGHSLQDNALTATIICRLPNPNTESMKQLESLWIHKMGTVYPQGLNEYDPTGIQN